MIASCKNKYVNLDGFLYSCLLQIIATTSFGGPFIFFLVMKIKDCTQSPWIAIMVASLSYILNAYNTTKKRYQPYFSTTKLTNKILVSSK